MTMLDRFQAGEETNTQASLVSVCVGLKRPSLLMMLLMRKLTFLAITVQ